VSSFEALTEVELLTVDELARRAGTTTRNVRVYQDRGLLPPPQRKGRLGLYGPDHLIRLQLVLRMLGRGYPLAAIRELVQAWESQCGLGDVLGLEGAMIAPYLKDAPVRVSRDAARDMLGGDDVALQRAIGASLFVADGDDLVIENPRFVEIATELVADGIPAHAVIAAAIEIEAAADRLAAVMVGVLDKHVWRDFVDAGMPVEDREAVTALIGRMRLRANAAVVAALAAAMQEKVDATFTGTLEQLARRTAERKKPAQ
jgi:DNA-binding transcriptional MerR regulator